MNKKPGYILLAVVAVLLWSTAFAFIKYALHYLEPYTIAGIRFTGAGLALWLVSIIFEKEPISTVFRHWRLVLTVSFFQTVVLYGLFFYGISLARGAQSAVIIGLSPLTTAVTAHFVMHNEKLSRRRLLSLLLAFTGIVIISVASKPWSAAGRQEFFGLVVLFLATFSSIVGNILVAKAGVRKNAMSPLRLCGWQMTLGGPVIFALAMIRGETIPDTLPWSIPAVIVWLSTISATGFGIWFFLLRRVKVSDLNLWKFLIPVGGAIFSWIILAEEHPDPATITGMICVALGIIVYYYNNRPEKPPQTPPTPPPVSV